MKINKINFMLLTLMFLLGITACSSTPDSSDFKLYEGSPLNIGVIGEIPEVKEEQINFEKIDFNFLLQDDIKNFDAVFIMKENLPQASEDQYADIYLNTNLSFFFIGATKTYHPFIEKDLTYEDALDLKDSANHYAVGYLSSEKAEDRYWYYMLYNDKESPENIKEMYSRFFSTIESNY